MIMFIYVVSPEGIFADTCLQITLIFQEGLGHSPKNSRTETCVGLFLVRRYIGSNIDDAYTTAMDKMRTVTMDPTQ
jgi:hypothetical protein